MTVFDFTLKLNRMPDDRDGPWVRLFWRAGVLVSGVADVCRGV